MPGPSRATAGPAETFLRVLIDAVLVNRKSCFLGLSRKQLIYHTATLSTGIVYSNRTEPKFIQLSQVYFYYFVGLGLHYLRSRLLLSVLRPKRWFQIKS